MASTVSPLCLATIGLALSFAAPALSGTLTPSSHPGCDYEFRGQIVPGDADQLEAIRGSYDGVTLCLDSPGGSVAAGQAMFETVTQASIRTRIPAGWRCESICAVVFMAGSVEMGLGVPITQRTHQLDPGGVLGFHAPGLDLPAGGTYSSDQIAAAFDIALTAAASFYRASLQERDNWTSFNQFLLARILETPHDQMYRIDTVADAILAQVQLGPALVPGQFSAAEVMNLCDAAYLRQARPLYSVPKGPTLDAWQFLRGSHLTAEARAFEEMFFSIRLGREGDDLVGLVGGYDVDRWSMTGCELRVPVSAVLAGVTLPEYGEEETSVVATFYSLSNHDESGTPARDWQPDPDYVLSTWYLPLWMAHDPATPLPQLAP